jgi:ADP-heptose:LPS heptosyltransferase
MAVLVIKNDGIGDLVLASGLITDIAEQAGPVELVTCRQNREIAERIPGVARCHYVSRDSIRLGRWASRIGWDRVHGDAEDHEVLAALAATEFETAIALRRFVRMSSLILMSKVRARTRLCAWEFATNADLGTAQRLSAGWNRWEGGRDTQHELDYFRQFLEATLGLKSARPPGLAGLPIQEATDATAVGLIISGASTNWPSAHWQELAVELRSRGHRLFLFGGTDSEGLARDISSRVPDVVSHVGVLSLEESVPHLARMSFIVGNDTGLTHYASLVARRVFVVMGGGTFGRFFPWPGATHQTVVFCAMECFDCDWVCKYATRECLSRVEAARVLQTIEATMAGHAQTTINLNADRVRFQVGWRRPDGTAPRMRTVAGGLEAN